MKKIIIKIITILLAFFAGIYYMSFLYNKGNLDMTSHMAEATLPVLYFAYEEQLTDPIYGYTSEVDASCLRDGLLPLDEDRTLRILLERYNAGIESVQFEVRSADTERLIQNETLEDLTENGQYVEGTLKIKDLLEDDQEYLLIISVETDRYDRVQYFTRIKNASYELVDACLGFAMDFHNATLNPDNDYPITQYLETDTTRTEDSLACIDIHSRYKNLIWAGMNPQQKKEPTMTLFEIGEDVVSLQLSYEVSRENEEGQTEDYKVRDYFRIRNTNLRMYLLDYERITERIFTADETMIGEKLLKLGIQWETPEYRSNEEGNVVNFVVSDELWSYDIAQNKLSKVFSFKNGTDQRGLHDEFKIRIINTEDTGSMDFTVAGYMNRGIHEGEMGIAVMHYDSLTNTTEELLFIESSQCFGTLSETFGELLYISHDDKMYLSYGETIYAIDLNTKNVETLTEELEQDHYVISKEGDMIAWCYGKDKYSSVNITTMDMKTGVRKTYEAPTGEILRPLGFSGDDFLYGFCKESDISEDFAGNQLFPIYQVCIADSKGDVIREFDYLAKNKYVISAEVENNRINLSCVEKKEDGSYEATLTEAITSNEEEEVHSITLSKEKDSVKKLEEVFLFSIKAEGKRKEITPKQVVYENNRTIALKDDEDLYHAYGKGRVQGVYKELRQAIQAAYEEMGVVTDHAGKVVWQRGGRKTRNYLELSKGCEPVNASNRLEAGLKLLLEQEGVYTDVSQALSQNQSPYEILKQNSQYAVENLTGCNLSSVLYYVSEGNYVLAMTDADHGWILTGYDAQNVYVLDAQSGQVTKIGMKDAAEQYETAGNVFFAFRSFT